eukprot:COSAG01_NODE_584_length_15174_cov_27.387901_23_plen_61_part_00
MALTAAAPLRAEVVGAYEVDRVAGSVYHANFGMHPCTQVWAMMRMMIPCMLLLLLLLPVL